MKNLRDFNLSKYSISSDGRVYSHYSKRFLNRSIGQDGYYKQTLTTDDKQVKTYRVSRLVGMAYCPGYAEDLVINHKDGDKLNNRPENLEWTTIQGNTIHAIENQLQVNAGGCEITDISLVHEVCRMLEQGYRKKDIVEMTGLSARKITEIQNKTLFKFISDEYEIDYVKKAHRLSPETVLKICEELASGKICYHVSRDLGIANSVVYRIQKRTSYSDISKTFNW